MRVIPPLAITGAILTSSTCAEPHATETAYNPATTYALGTRVVVAADHRTYESLQAGNIGHTPISSPTWWLDVGPTRRWAMFDLLRNTQTETPSPLTVVLTPGERINAVALVGLEATSVTVSMTSAGVPVYTHTENLNTRDTTDWYAYFFDTFSTRSSVVLFDLPPYTNGVVTIAITNSAGDALCGGCVIGSGEFLGTVQTDAESDSLNFSSVTRDNFGNTTLVPRRSVPKTTQTLWVGKSRIDRILKLRDALNAAPAVWSGVDDSAESYFEALLILGYYRQFLINMAYPDNAKITLQLEEL